MGEGTVILLLILAAGLLGGNELVSVSAAVLLFLRASGLGHAFQFLEEHGLDLGIVFLLLGLLLPFATDRLGVAATASSLTKPAGLIAVGVGTLAAYLAAQGVAMLRLHPEVLVGLIVGSVIGVYFLKGIPAGPLVAAGIASVLYRLVAR
ncbi:MAG TPA: DUF441 domain-containing protein [Limnochordales bacterium]